MVEAGGLHTEECVRAFSTLYRILKEVSMCRSINRESGVRGRVTGVG